MTSANRRHDRRAEPKSSDQGPQRSDAAVVLRALLSRNPEALVAAIDPGAAGGFVPVPADLPIEGHRLLKATSMLDVVAPADRVVVIETWERARKTGISRAPIHLLASPERAAVLHFVDVRAEFGVFVGIVLPGDGETALTEPSEATGLPPRIARVRKDELAILTEIDAATTRILGWTDADTIGHRSLEFVHPEDHERAIQSWLQMLANPAATQAVRLRHRRADGSWLWMEVSNLNLLDVPAERCVLTEMIDISDEMAAHEALRAREQLLLRLAEALPIGILQIASDRRIVYANDRLADVLGTGPVTSLDDRLATVVPEDRLFLDAAVQTALADGIDRDIEVRVELPKPVRIRRCMIRLRALFDERGHVNGAIVCVEDVTQSAALRVELEQQATHDMLTQLLNRRSIMALLDQALATDPNGTAVIFIDLDGFKSVNDRFGHLVGDELLRVAADRLAATVRAGDAIGRIGGDEFLVVCTDVPTIAKARNVARRVADALGRGVLAGGGTIELRASVGLAYANRSDLTSDELVGQADAAMYESKRLGEGRPVTWVKRLAAA